MKRFLIACCALIVLVATSRAETSVFGQIKADLAAAPCVRFEFLALVESDVFDLVDSSSGEAYLARDGRYSIRIGADQYLCDGSQTYSYSPENNQVVIEDVSAGSIQEVSFLVKLDSFYVTRPGSVPGCYLLDRRDTTASDLPDSLTVWVDGSEKRIERMEYFDINREYNRIILLRQVIDSTCAEDCFRPEFGPSVEKVTLP